MVDTAYTLGDGNVDETTEEAMMTIPDYIIYDDIRRREEAEQRDGALQPLHLPLYRPEIEEQVERSADEDEAPSRGVIIIDMNSWVEVTDD